MTKVQRESKKVQVCQRILAIAMLEAEQNSVFPTTKMSTVFDSLEYLDFVMRLHKEIGPIPNDKSANAETFNDLAEFYASAG